jgi:hypothetical protein
MGLEGANEGKKTTQPLAFPPSFVCARQMARGLQKYVHCSCTSH